MMKRKRYAETRSEGLKDLWCSSHDNRKIPTEETKTIVAVGTVRGV